jgi:hypothetical protein
MPPDRLLQTTGRRVKGLQIALPVLLLAAFGWWKAPAEHRLLKTQRGAGFQLASLSADARAQLGQSGFIAALSGFRALMADLLWIKAGTSFERTEWSRMQLLMHTATRLQPRAVLFWEMAQAHMAYDAATAMRMDDERQPSPALRRKAELQFIRIGETFLKDGIAFNSDSSRLWEKLGDLYSRRLYAHREAHEAYLEAARRPGAMSYLRRFSAYELAKIPGREADAYNALKALYEEGEAQRLPTLLRLLDMLGKKLAVTPE